MFNQNYDSETSSLFFDFSFVVHPSIIAVARLLSKSCDTSNKNQLSGPLIVCIYCKHLCRIDRPSKLVISEKDICNFTRVGVTSTYLDFCNFACILNLSGLFYDCVNRHVGRHIRSGRHIIGIIINIIERGVL